MTTEVSTKFPYSKALLASVAPSRIDRIHVFISINYDSAQRVLTICTKCALVERLSWCLVERSLLSLAFASCHWSRGINCPKHEPLFLPNWLGLLIEIAQVDWLMGARTCQRTFILNLDNLFLGALRSSHGTRWCLYATLSDYALEICMSLRLLKHIRGEIMKILISLVASVNPLVVVYRLSEDQVGVRWCKVHHKIWTLVPSILVLISCRGKIWSLCKWLSSLTGRVDLELLKPFGYLNHSRGIVGASFIYLTSICNGDVRPLLFNLILQLQSTFTFCFRIPYCRRESPGGNFALQLAVAHPPLTSGDSSSSCALTSYGTLRGNI